MVETAEFLLRVDATFPDATVAGFMFDGKLLG